MSKSRNWCFTWNNYPAIFNADVITQQNVEAIFGKFKYICIGREVGASGTPHIQGYVDWINARPLGGLTRINSSIHWEMRRGTWNQAVSYCKKDNNFSEYGTPNEQGARKDLKQLRDEIAAGLRVDDVLMEDPMVYHQYGRTLNKIEDLTMRKKYRTEMTQGIWYWGRTGVGKSHTALQGFTPETHYIWPNDKGWWDGYVQQPVVVINDFRGEIPYNEMLQLIDKWPLSLRRRNREPIPFMSSLVIITSSLPPEEVYHRRAEEDLIQQLLRRITVIELTGTEVTEVTGTEVLRGGNTNPPEVAATRLPTNNTNNGAARPRVELSPLPLPPRDTPTKSPTEELCDDLKRKNTAYIRGQLRSAEECGRAEEARDRGFL